METVQISHSSQSREFGVASRISGAASNWKKAASGYDMLEDCHNDVLSTAVIKFHVYVFVLSFFVELLKNIRIDQGFPHIVVCSHWCHILCSLVLACFGLFYAVYVYVLSALYYHADVIANLELI